METRAMRPLALSSLRGVGVCRALADQLPNTLNSYRQGCPGPPEDPLSAELSQVAIFIFPLWVWAIAKG